MNLIDVFWITIRLAFGFTIGLLFYHEHSNIFIAIVLSVIAYFLSFFAIVGIGHLFPRFGRLPLEKIYEIEGLIFDDEIEWIGKTDDSLVFRITNRKCFAQKDNKIYRVENDTLGDVILEKKLSGWRKIR